MAGQSDSCPKCGADITAPALLPVLPPDEPVEIAPPFSAPLPVEVATPKPESPLPSSELIQSHKTTITPRKKILQQDAVLPLVQPSLSKNTGSDLLPHFTPITQNILPSSKDPLLEPAYQAPETTARPEEDLSLTTMTALIPLTESEDVPIETSATTPGMGEILAEQSSSNTVLQNQDTRPWLQGPYLSTSGSKNIQPSIFSNWPAFLISFLLIDLFIYWIFHDQITSFFQGEKKSIPTAQARPIPLIPKKMDDTSVPTPKDTTKATPHNQSAAKPLAPLPMDKPTSSPDTVQFAPVPVETIAPKAIPIPPIQLPVVSAEVQSALDVLVKFLAASTWNERVTYAQKPEIVNFLMEKYASISGDGPIIISNITFIERFKNDKGTHCTFEVSGGSLPHPVMAIVEQASNGTARVDWEAFMEFKDDLLLKFLESNGAPNQKFRFSMQRMHYFDKDVPDQDSKESFGIRQPNSTFEGHIFLDKKTSLATHLATQLPWGKDLLIIAELTWKKDGINNWVELQEIISYGWRY